MMLSESQERMLAVLKPGREAEAERIFKKWELDFSVIGVTTDTHRMVVRHKGEIVADMPVTALSDAAPIYERPYVKRDPARGPVSFDATRPAMQSLLRLLSTPDLASKRWIWEQYDYTVMADSVQRPGGDAAVVRVHGSNKGLACTTDVTPRYAKADPFEGAKQAVAEAWRNITAVGGLPLAVTDCLNFSNPEKPEAMGEIVSGIEGLGEACRALAFPIVSGNCSLYNETQGEGILPTPTIGGVGLLQDVNRMASLGLKRAGDAILLIGRTRGHLGQSVYLRELEGLEDGAAPPVDLAVEKKNGDFVRGLIEAGTTDTVHDIADGGLLVALAEMTMAGGIGAVLRVNYDADKFIPFLFGEDQARYLVAVPADQADAVLAAAKDANVVAAHIGFAGATNASGEPVLMGVGLPPVTVAALKATHEAWLPSYMKG
jgi:phosphoribosylformylglycinamidine synthase